MKIYLLAGLLLVSVASLEFFHVLASDHAADFAACMVDGKAEAVRDFLLSHFRSH